MSNPLPTLEGARPLIWADEHERLLRRCAESRALCERAELLASGLDDAETQLAEASAALSALEDLILATPADTLGALSLKAQLITQLPSACRHPDETDAMFATLARDIERLAR